MKLNWDEVDDGELEHLYYDENLSDSMIADRFGVSKNQVTYKRRKFGISIKNKVFMDIMSNQNTIWEGINSNSKEHFVNKFDLDATSKAIVHYIFRNGPVEDMHSNGQLTDVDMKVLNKFMTNKVAGLIELIMNNEWLKLEMAFDYYKMFGINWDKVEPDVKELEEIFSIEINKSIKSLKDSL